MITVVDDLPTVYADTNVFRYVAYGEMTISAFDRFRWVYSHVHLDEIRRSGNRDALRGMRQLRAVEIEDVLDEQFKSVGKVILHDYVDPDIRFQRHLQAVSGYEKAGDSLTEVQLRLFGAENFEELSRAPEAMIAEVNRLTAGVTSESGEDLRRKMRRLASEIGDVIEQHMKEKKSLDQVRNALGLTSENRSVAAKAVSPIDALWEAMEQLPVGLDKDQFFGLKPIPGVCANAVSQDCTVAGAYTVLNMLGLSADKRLAKRDGLKSTMSDSQHVGMASYCHTLLSGDKRLCDKANAVYIYIGAAARAVHFEYKPEGFTVNL